MIVFVHRECFIDAKHAWALGMDVDQFRHFLKVVETQSFTHAAAQLSMSQPAISRSVQRLEEEFGQPLFERQNRQVKLTEAGEMLLPRVHQILSLLDEAKQEICDDGQTGRLRIGAIPTIAPYFLPAFLQSFSREFPKAAICVQEDTTGNLLGSLKQGEIDLAVLALPVAAKYLEIEALFDEELLLVHSSHHPLHERKQVQFGDITKLPFVLLAEAHCLSENILGFCSQRSFHPISLEKANQLSTVLELVAINHGISLIPEMARRCDSNPARVYRSLAGTKPVRTIAIVWNSYRFQSKLLQEFQAALRIYSERFASKMTKNTRSVH